ncbi:Arginine N-methyltransferase [Phytophthora palmivora]|uniref:Arginine N-methyltransferase n=1 Tax=Phytophthora palmivora TaxID=4796 RepID=A0A2P4XZU6_9STRA|nr:Arginine N-methyltransferase [Phytophthora palmivora]
MTTQGNRKTLDELGQEVIWSSLGQQVMMQWEKQYMEQCVNALAILPTDRVLEIGFGLAYSASHIQTFQPKSHTIIECDQETLQRAQRFAARHRGVEIVAGTWQQQLPTLDQFDCIFFDDYPLPELELENPPARSRAFGRQRSRWHEFLDVALKHCATGARISGYLARKLDLKRPGCQISVSRVPVDVPDHCNYFPHKTALVPVIRVTDRDVAGGSNLEVEALLPLPHMSKKFLRVFGDANGSGQVPTTSLSREQEHLAGIREFLLAQELGALSYEQLSSGEEDNAMDDGALSSGVETKWGDQQEDDNSMHYKDQQSRREFLQMLRSRAVASKQKFG